MDSDPSRQPPTQQQLVMGRKASSTSAIDKLNKKKKKKKRSKKDKRSSTTTNSAPAVSGRARARKTRAVTSCPPHLDSLFPSINSSSTRRNDGDLDEVCDLFNENLRWLPLIANYSKNHPINSASSANSAVQAKLTESTRTLKEDSEDEGERMDVYKTNRRKRYLAAQQRILDLYPDQKAANDYIVAAGDCSEKPNPSGAGILVRPPQAPVHLPVSAKPSLTSIASSDAIPSSSSSKSYEKIDFAVPNALNATPGLTSSIAQKVL